MNRFRLYSVLFLANVFVFFISTLFNLHGVLDIFIFLSFISSILYLLFTFEEPPKLESLKIPEVHNYYRSKQDNKNNILALEFVFVSLCFFVLLYSTSLSLPVVVLILWALSIPVTYFIILVTSRNDNLNKILDYIRFVKPDINRGKSEKIIKGFLKLNSLNRQVLIKSVRNEDKPIAALLADIYISYMVSIGNSLIAGEIEEINDL